MSHTNTTYIHAHPITYQLLTRLTVGLLHSNFGLSVHVRQIGGGFETALCTLAQQVFHVLVKLELLNVQLYCNGNNENNA